MWTTGWREVIWEDITTPWDMVIIGGGITGAGILREAARAGLRVLLVEQRDFGWGTSSRSSKLVHGGLRYLASGQLGLTFASVREREQLLEEGPGLIDPLGFLLATHKGDNPGRWTYRAGLTVYDLMALQWSHEYCSADAFRMFAPYITDRDLEGGFRYGDAQTDDARLTLRVIREAVADGGVALNYATATTLLKTDERVIGVQVRDEVTGRSANIFARVVVNATGAWADALREQVSGSPLIRPLRGSHLIFARWRLPLAQAVSFLHPVDRRPVFAFPWEDVTLVGTTDVDHADALNQEPRISPDEVAYLMAAVTHQFPSRNLTLDDVIATLAGVRPVIDTGKDDPSKESREHIVRDENGLLTVTGGKLTTFRLIALDVLKTARQHLPELEKVNSKTPVLNPVDVALEGINHLSDTVRQRLLGRYGADAPHLVAMAQPDELRYIPGTRSLWAELRWAARGEGVIHLEDLLLRRVRLGLLLPEGGAAIMDRVRAICQPELGWDHARWQAEETAYRALWRAAYGLPPRDTIPNWDVMLAHARHQRMLAEVSNTPRSLLKTLSAIAGVLLAMILVKRRRRFSEN